MPVEAAASLLWAPGTLGSKLAGLSRSSITATSERYAAAAGFDAVASASSSRQTSAAVLLYLLGLLASIVARVCSGC